MILNKIKKIASVFLCALSLFTFFSCELDDGIDGVTVTLSASSIEVTDAIVGLTTKNISASTSDGSGVVWSSNNAGVVSVKPSGNNAVIFVNGAGRAVVVATTKDGKASARCEVRVSLSDSRCEPVSNAAITEGSIKDTSITVTWTDSKDMSYANVVILNEDGTVFSTKKVAANVQMCTVTDIVTNNEGINYSVRVDAVRNNWTAVGTPIPFKTLPDATPCDDVSDLTATKDDHSITLNWTDPSDEELYKVVVAITGVELDGTQIAEKELNIVNVSKNVTAQTVKIERLKANTDYSFVVKTLDKAGNLSDGVSKTVKTDRDTTAPGKVSNVVRNVNTSSVEFMWDDATDVDFKEVEISYSGKSAVVSKGVMLKDITGLTPSVLVSFEIRSVDYDGNKSEPLTFSITPQALVHNVAFTNKYTDTGYVTWTDVAGENDYTYKVTVKNSGAEDVVLPVAKGVQKQYITGVKTGTTVVVATIDGEYEYKDDATTLELAEKKIVWDIALCGGFFDPDKRVYHLVCGINSIKGGEQCIPLYETDGTYKWEAFSYKKWLVVSSLNNPTDVNEFSLIATDDTGINSGYYLYADADRTVESGSTYQGHWGGTGDKPLLWVGKVGDKLTEGKFCNASFKTKTNTGTVTGNILALSQEDFDQSQFAISFTDTSGTVRQFSLKGSIMGTTTSTTATDVNFIKKEIVIE